MAYVYLVKLFRMHKIGRTDNFERRMEQLKPYEDDSAPVQTA